jgi:hypothetical protein
MIVFFIWSRVSGMMRFLTAHQKWQHVNICEGLRQITSDLQPSCAGLLLVTRAEFTVMTLLPMEKSKLTERKVKSWLIIFYDVKEIVHK